MEPQQLSPGGAGTAAATEASSTNGGTMGITVTEPDTSTMQKQTAGLSASLFVSFAAEAKFVVINVERCRPNCSTHMFQTCSLQFYIPHWPWCVFIADKWWDN
jgi:hypothetical protein